MNFYRYLFFFSFLMHILYVRITQFLFIIMFIISSVGAVHRIRVYSIGVCLKSPDLERFSDINMCVCVCLSYF
jgi:hypothetical protein